MIIIGVISIVCLNLFLFFSFFSFFVILQRLTWNVLAQTDDQVGGFVSLEELERTYETYKTTEALDTVTAVEFSPPPPTKAAGM